MKFALDTEFIDTPLASELISLALVAEDGRELYMEFPYTQIAITPWLAKNVVPLLIHDSDAKLSFAQGAQSIREFVGGSKFDVPEFWAYYAAYDWYWFCRVFGGFMELPRHYPHLIRDLAHFQQDLPNISGPEHFALNDARSVMHAMKLRGFASDSTRTQCALNPCGSRFCSSLMAKCSSGSTPPAVTSAPVDRTRHAT
jgi:hypothetical protein